MHKVKVGAKGYINVRLLIHVDTRGGGNGGKKGAQEFMIERECCTVAPYHSQALLGPTRKHRSLEQPASQCRMS